MHRVWIALGGLAGFTAVAMASVAAHLLPQRLDPAHLRMVDSALHMQGWHALVLFLTGLWAALPRASGRRVRLIHAAGAAFAFGLLLFCGSVYALAIGGLRIGPTAPIGGMLLMAGWLLLLLAAMLGV